MLRRARALALAALAGAPLAGQADAVPIGGAVPDLSFVDIRAQRRRLSDLGPRRSTVLFFVTRGCPMAGRVLPQVGRLAAEFEPQGVRFAAVDVAAGEPARAMGAHAIEFGQPYPFVKDEDGRMVRTLGIERTTTAVVLDADLRLRYRGRVDDRVRYAHVRETATRADLREALIAVLEGRAVEVAETPVEGCLITPPAPVVRGSSRHTFHRDVEPIVQRHCQECHRAGGAGPFALLTYEDVAGNAAMVEEVVARQLMPPWHASEEHGSFRNRRGLDATERAALLEWLRSDLPRGDPAEAPPPREFPPGPWRIGTPDLVLTATAPMHVPEEGVVPYVHLVLPHVFAAETWIEALEILPENKRVLHHANLAYVERGKGFRPEGFITGYVPGGDPFVLDPGTAFRVPANSVFAVQAHYVTTGKPETDRIRVGVRFPRTPVTQRAEVLVVTDTRFSIPPGAPAHRVRAARRVPADATVIGMFAHMHLRGRDMTFVAHRPDAPPEVLLMIPSYDFEWQSSYRCHPGAVRLPAGTRLEVSAHFDNSPLNPFNPDHTATVCFGQQTYEEMMYGFVFYTRDGERLEVRVDPATGRAQ